MASANATITVNVAGLPAVKRLWERLETLRDSPLEEMYEVKDQLDDMMEEFAEALDKLDGA